MAADQDKDFTDADEVMALRDLVASPGWKLLTAYLDGQYGPRGYGHRMQAAIAEIGKGPERAYELAEAVERVDHSSQAVNEIIAWPKKRIDQLVGAQRKPGPFDGLRRIAR